MQAHHFIHEAAALNLEYKPCVHLQHVKTPDGLDRVWVRVSQVGKVGEVMLTDEKLCSLPARCRVSHVVQHIEVTVWPASDLYAHNTSESV